MPIDPSIALGFRGIQVADPLAQYGQMQNILAAQSQMRGAETQQQMSQMQLEQMRRDEATLKQIQDKAVQGGGPSDLNKIAEAYLKSGNPKFVEFGVVWFCLYTLENKNEFKNGTWENEKNKNGFVLQ